MNDVVIATPTVKHDWSRVDAMTDEQIHAAAMADPDAQPISDEAFARAKKVPRSKIIRRALKLTQEAFAERYRIPLATVQDWENGVSEPDQTARSYLRAIAGNAAAVWEALNAGPKPL